MVEINKPTTEPLELVVYKENKEVMKKELPLRAVNVKELYLETTFRGGNGHKASETQSKIWGASPLGQDPTVPDVTKISGVSVNFNGVITRCPVRTVRIFSHTIFSDFF